MPATPSRRRFLATAAAGLSATAVSAIAGEGAAAKPLPKAIAADGHFVTAPASIEVKARPIPFFDLRDHSAGCGSAHCNAQRTGAGVFLPGFGGLSAIRLDAKGERFISLSDQGAWFTGRIRYSGREMAGLADVEAAPMLGADGRPITARGWFDSESLALDGSLAYVGLERVNQVLRFDLAQGITRARGEVVPMPPAVKKLPYNKGLEAMVVVPKGLPLAGTLMALSERGLDAQGNLVAVLLVGGPSPGQFSVRRTDKFDISDAVVLSSGELLILERKFSLLSGIGIRIRRIPLSSIVPGALVDGPSIFHADLGQEIDNMEGIDVYPTPEGDTVLTMISDDNFSMIQRTLLLQFTLMQ